MISGVNKKRRLMERSTSSARITIGKNMQHVLTNKKWKFKSVGVIHVYLLVVY